MDHIQSHGLNVLHTPEERQALIADLLAKDGLEGTVEDPNVGYGILPLTGLGSQISDTNEWVKSCIQERQKILQTAMARAGIALYDPASAPYSPDAGLSAGPEKIYQTDSLRVAMARHVTFLDLLPTTGGGIEIDKANVMGKFTFIFHDPGIRTSRMQPHRTLHLAARELAAMQDELTELFTFIQQFDPCFALQDGAPAMTGRHRETGEYVNLQREVAQKWPHLMFGYDSQAPIVHMDVLNPEIFAEHQGVDVAQYRLSQKTSDYTLTITKLGETPVDAVLVQTQSGKLASALDVTADTGDSLDDEAILAHARASIAGKDCVLTQDFMQESLIPCDESASWPGNAYKHITAAPAEQADDEPSVLRFSPNSGRIAEYGYPCANPGGGSGYRFRTIRPQCAI